MKMYNKLITLGQELSGLAQLLEFELGELSPDGLNWYGILQFAAEKNGDPRPRANLKACATYLQECISKGKWRPPTGPGQELHQMIQIYGHDKVFGKLHWIWAFDPSYLRNTGATIDDGVTEREYRAAVCVGRIYSLGPTLRPYYISPHIDSPGRGTRLVRNSRQTP